MRLCWLLPLCRPVLPLLLGLCLGCSLSLLRVSWREAAGEDGCWAAGDRGLPGPEQPAEQHDFEPRIIPYNRGPDTPHRKVLRTRYIHTELGTRERLLVSVLTSRAGLASLAVAVNRTVAPHFSRLVYFTGMRGSAPPHGMQVVVLGDERPVWLMYRAVQHIHQHFASHYDWFYFVQDNSYTSAERVKALVSRLSIDQDLYLGRAEEFIGGDREDRYCHGGYGYLLSRRLLLRLQPHLDACRNHILSARPDEWLGRCLIDFTGTGCVSRHQDVWYRSFALGKNTDVEREDSVEFRAAITVHLVPEPGLMYHLHRRFSQLELSRTQREIEQLQEEIKNLSKLTPEGEAGATWPIGIPPPFRPQTRFEVINWDYFTEEHLFACAWGGPKCELGGASQADVADVIETAVRELNHKYQPLLHFRKRQLLNGYRRFDPTRGMEYTLDLALDARTQRGHSRMLVKRLSLLRPLGSVEIIPMPYVTEATRVHIILPLTVHQRDFATGFLDVFALNELDARDNTLLTLLFIYDPFDAQRVSQSDVFAGVKTAVLELEKRYPDVKIPWISVQTDVPSQIKIMDIISKKHPVDTLFFIASVWTEVNNEFLNRCRMNTITSWQVFFPIHFQEYNPSLVSRDPQAPLSSAEFFKDGHFDRQIFNEACFYNSDYMAARTKMAGEVLDNTELLESMEVYDVFIKYSDLHVFRPVEPALVQKYSHRTCNPRLSEDIYHRCVLSNLQGLASRSHLALAMFEQEQANST